MKLFRVKLVGCMKSNGCGGYSVSDNKHEFIAANSISEAEDIMLNHGVNYQYSDIDSIELYTSNLIQKEKT